MPARSAEQRALPPWDLKAQREKHGYTQAKAAEILFTTQATVARWESDGNTPMIYRKYWEIWHNAKKVKKAQKKSVKVRPREEANSATA